MKREIKKRISLAGARGRRSSRRVVRVARRAAHRHEREAAIQEGIRDMREARR